MELPVVGGGGEEWPLWRPPSSRIVALRKVSNADFFIAMKHAELQGG